MTNTDAPVQVTPTTADWKKVDELSGYVSQPNTVMEWSQYSDRLRCALAEQLALARHRTASNGEGASGYLKIPTIAMPKGPRRDAVVAAAMKLAPYSADPAGTPTRDGLVFLNAAINEAAAAHFASLSTPATPMVDERATIVAWLREQSDKGADIALGKGRGSTARASYGGGSLAISRAADEIEQGAHLAAATMPTPAQDAGEAANPICALCLGVRIVDGKACSRCNGIGYQVSSSQSGEVGRLPADVVRLVIAARFTLECQDRETLAELDQASEAFASRVPWEDE